MDDIIGYLMRVDVMAAHREGREIVDEDDEVVDMRKSAREIQNIKKISRVEDLQSNQAG